MWREGGQRVVWGVAQGGEGVGGVLLQGMGGVELWRNGGGHHGDGLGRL